MNYDILIYIPTLMAASYHARCCPDLGEQFGVRCLARGRFSMWTGGPGDRSANPGTSGPHALPPEPQPPQTGIKSTETHFFFLNNTFN